MNITSMLKCHDIADYYGRVSQTDIAIEEMSELTKALLKHRRNEENIAEILDELADVSIMVEQMIYLYGLLDDIDRHIEFKIERQLGRMENG